MGELTSMLGPLAPAGAAADEDRTNSGDDAAATAPARREAGVPLRGFAPGGLLGSFCEDAALADRRGVPACELR